MIWSFGANAMTAPVAISAEAAMPIISQKPDRVSNILRSSTWRTRVKGIRAGHLSGRTGRGGRASVATVSVALMLQLLLVRCLR